VRRPTPQQEAIYDAVRSGGSNLCVSALAGTGKTTTAVSCLSQGVSGRVGFVAFNSHIADELRSRLPPEVPAMTLHSLGYATVRRAFRDAVLDPQKLTKLARELAPKAYPSTRQVVEQLARLCKMTLTPECDQQAVDSLVDHYGIEIDGRDREAVLDLAAQLVERSVAWLATLDYDDMVWVPVRLGLPVDQFDLLLVDEAQDLNRAQQCLALAASAGGRLCPIGDVNQAIYGFSGADCDSLPNLARELGGSPRGCDVLPLTVTWRCPTSHVELARRIVPGLEPAPGAIDGEVTTASREQITAAVRPGDMVVCRKNAPLVGLTYRLVLAGTPALMRGRDIGKGLLSLISRLRPDSISDLDRRLEHYREREEAKLHRRDAPASAYEQLEDRCECLSQLAAQATSLESLEAFIKSVFDDGATPAGRVVLSSVHRGKGLEADTVYVLDPDSLPLIRRDSKSWQRTQERNLVYIAATRAKRSLVFETRVPTILLRGDL
jgi:DNA helicase-2/ATP-dependent DNA helicase PcrA